MLIHLKTLKTTIEEETRVLMVPHARYGQGYIVQEYENGDNQHICSCSAI